MNKFAIRVIVSIGLLLFLGIDISSAQTHYVENSLKVWEKHYEKDEFGDEDSSKPFIAFDGFSDESRDFAICITPTNGFIFYIEGLDEISSSSYDVSLSVKEKYGGVYKIPTIFSKAKGCLTFPGWEANHALMTYFNQGKLKIVVKIQSKYDREEAPEYWRFIFEGQTTKIWEATQKYLEDVPGFWDYWGGDMYDENEPTEGEPFSE